MAIKAGVNGESTTFFTARFISDKPSTTPTSTTIISNGTTMTFIISPIGITDMDDNPTKTFISSFIEVLPTNSPYITAIISNGISKTAVVSPFVLTGNDGKLRTGFSTSFF